jgi:thiamine-phosphate pyrophosphorylase
VSNASYRIRGLYVITRPRPDLIDAVERALHGGAHVVQHRAKETKQAERRAEARALVALCARFGVPLIVNDDPALAREVGAAGVHLGREDADLAHARTLLGPQAIIGVSCYNELERAHAAAGAGADYVAFGSFYPSSTKPHAVRAAPALLADARAQLSLPLVAIGGITPDNGAALIAAGADALAVIEGVFGEADTEGAARRYAALFTERQA